MAEWGELVSPGRNSLGRPPPGATERARPAGGSEAGLGSGSRKCWP